MKNILPTLFFCGLMIMLLSGCGNSESGYVSGVVKINGEPVEGAFVTFTPKEGGRQATAVTNGDGSYELDYTPGVKGAKIGTNAVRLTTYASSSVDDDGKVTDPGMPELFPPEYYEGQNVTVDVQSGKNTFDFDVEASQESYTRSSE